MHPHPHKTFHEFEHHQRDEPLPSGELKSKLMAKIKNGCQHFTEVWKIPG